MSKHEQPKFHIGDRVAIDQNGLVSEIKKIYQIGGEWFYQVKDSHDLYFEKNLLAWKDHKKNIILQKQENVQIEYRFQFGDIVRVNGYGQDLFVIIGFRAEIWRYKDSAWEDFIYECSRLYDGAWVEAGEDELTYITNEENAKKLLNAKKQQGKKSPLLIASQKMQNRKQDMENIDSLLDLYNDYQYLYLNFGESGYQKKMKEILKKLEAMSKHRFQNNE